jgi:hypothetical protein
LVELVEDGFGRRGPDEGLGRLVVGGDVAGDGVLQVGDGGEGAAPDFSPGDGGEETLDGVEHEADVGVKWNVQRG